MKKFQEFAAKMTKYDVVLDGLNIAYSTGLNKGSQVFSNILCSVISHFANQNKSILMLGRVHMTNWPRNNWNYIKENADIFLTQNISEDDPYLLYCALNSGKDTIIVTRDLMRSHTFLLKERKYKIMFKKWLDQRQWFLLTCNNQRTPIFRKPPHFTQVAQKNGEFWHVPYDPKDEGKNNKYHRTWCCVNMAGS
ncbi:mitochondrial ribonuclease P catalytic subunit isoform X3 [Anthonomus grandis grandis]|nr:mitochondrial ribonuclease P catalytic subunit isoform X3 [Anthonomus grandis grandis]